MLINQAYQMAGGPSPPYVYLGADSCAELAIYSPKEAVLNPDSYVFFASGELPRR